MFDLRESLSNKRCHSNNTFNSHQKSKRGLAKVLRDIFSNFEPFNRPKISFTFIFEKIKMSPGAPRTRGGRGGGNNGATSPTVSLGREGVKY
jgi:hypothetical protein